MFHKTCTNRSSLLASSILLQRSLAREEKRRRRKESFQKTASTLVNQSFTV
jgi:hypothetical protein